MHGISIAAEKIFGIGGFAVTNTLILSWVVVALLASVAYIYTRRPKLVPVGFQNVFEYAIEGVLGLMEGVMGSREKATKYFPFVATIFLFVLVSNWMGIFPVLGALGINEVHHGESVFVPLFRSGASDLNFTLALALIAVIGIQVAGITAIGLGKYLHKFFTLKNPIYTFVGLLELLSEIAKMVSFSFRLFGNVFAGEVLLIIIGFLAPYVVPIPFLGLEIFVGLIQALVFAMLTVVFITSAISESH